MKNPILSFAAVGMLALGVSIGCNPPEIEHAKPTKVPVPADVRTGAGLEPALDQSPQEHPGGWSSIAPTSDTPIATVEDNLPVVTSFEIKRGMTLAQGLQKQGLSYELVHQIISASHKKIDMTRIPIGTKVRLWWQEQLLTKVSVRWDALVYYEVVLQEHGEWRVKEIKKEPEIRLRTFSSNVVFSLWRSAQDVGMDPGLIQDLAEIFAWQIDFAREVRKGDSWTIQVDELMVEGQSVGWGKIKFAEYVNRGEKFTAVYFKSSDGKIDDYFFPDGESLRRMFLKSPIRFAPITSRFSKKRFHPILKKRVPHNGVDYGAPIGTPVRTVGDGTVVKSGRYGPSGIMVKIRHNSVYTTAYLHLSRLAKGMKRGRVVKQGSIIGYVGKTGRATGPHLHFSFYERGRFVDPLGRKFPSADPVPAGYREEFKQLVNQNISEISQVGQPSEL